jgi:hypothetical protein
MIRYELYLTHVMRSDSGKRLRFRGSVISERQVAITTATFIGHRVGGRFPSETVAVNHDSETLTPFRYVECVSH